MQNIVDIQKVNMTIKKKAQGNNQNRAVFVNLSMLLATMTSSSTVSHINQCVNLAQWVHAGKEYDDVK